MRPPPRRATASISTPAPRSPTSWRPNLLPAEYPPTPSEEEVFSFDFPALNQVEDAIYIPSIFQDSSYVLNAGSPGTWTITAVPEPATWATMLLGFAGLGAAMRGRRGRVGVVG